MTYHEELKKHENLIKEKVTAWISARVKANYLTTRDISVKNRVVSFCLWSPNGLELHTLNYLKDLFNPANVRVDSRIDDDAYESALEIEFQNVPLPDALTLPTPPEPPPARYVWVVANTTKEFNDWCKENDMVGYKNRVAKQAETFRIYDGLVEGWEVVYTGEWHKRLDLEELQGKMLRAGLKLPLPPKVEREVHQEAFLAAYIFEERWLKSPTMNHMVFWDSLSFSEKCTVRFALVGINTLPKEKEVK